jgi:hypothetical protein
VSEIKIQILYNGRMADAIDVPIVHSNELWSEYKLEDGTTLRVKLAVGSIARVVGEYDAEGNPVYVAKGVMISVPLVSESQRKKG